MPLDATPSRAMDKPAVAMRYHLATTRAREDNAEKESATKAAVASGVLFDHKANPEEPGTNRVVYDDGTVHIVVKVASAGERLDGPAFLEALVTVLKVPPAKLQRLVAKHTHPTAAAHSFTSSLVEG
jgi:hypothetical protein